MYKSIKELVKIEISKLKSNIFDLRYKLRVAKEDNKKNDIFEYSGLIEESEKKIAQYEQELKNINMLIREYKNNK